MRELFQRRDVLKARFTEASVDVYVEEESKREKPDEKATNSAAILVFERFEAVALVTRPSLHCLRTGFLHCQPLRVV